MQSNWKKRYNNYQDSLVGKKMDHFINMGVKLAYCAIHEELGIGRKKLERVTENIHNRIEKDFKDGASKYSYEYSINVELGEERLEREYLQIMTYGDKAAARRVDRENRKQKKL